MKKWLLRISLSIAVLAGALLRAYIYLQHPSSASCRLVIG
jgi:hypothetical protein